MFVLTSAEQGAEHGSTDYFHLELSVSGKEKHTHNAHQIRQAFYSMITLKRLTSQLSKEICLP